ncbi:hypothetical protein DW974_20045 [Lachnospiraceae bacterium AM48-27BH]|nr:hypothetical protein DW974_20045 [Lachnospiraceae bacterium AM48-27BH]
MAHLYQKPIEMPRGTHYGSDYWIAYSYKIKRMVHFYSMLEYANFIKLDMNPAVEYFCEQPLKIEDKDSSSVKKSSVFDFWVQYVDSKNEFQEIKYSSDITGSTESAIRAQKQIDFQRNWCISNQYNYRVVTEKDLYTGQFEIPNLELLHQHLLRYSKISRYSPQNLFELLTKKPLCIEEIQANKILPEKYELSILAYQYYLGNIDMTLKERPLDKYTEVKLCEIKSTIS